MILRCEAIFCRAAASILVSSISSFSSALRASCRMVLRSSRKSTSGTSASVSAMVWASLLSLSREILYRKYYNDEVKKLGL